MYSIDNEKIGAYLKELIKKSGYKTDTEFCKEYLRLANKSDKISDDQLQNIRNRFSQIFKGIKKIQTYDLPILAHIFHVSCEEILSAGQIKCTSSHTVTNYGIANSHDREVWDEYMKRDDRLFLNCDEYRKTVIDYALESKNYDFMKYLLEEGFIWFVDNSEKCSELLKVGFGAGTKVKSNWERFDVPDNALRNEFTKSDRLRTQTIALAIENEDFDILDSLRAREFPQMGDFSIFGNRIFNFDENRNDNLIEVIASTENERILKYFSDEFTVQEFNISKNRKHSFLFLYLSDVIELMIKNKKDNFAELLLRKAIDHSKKTYKTLDDMIKLACKLHHDIKNEQIDDLMKMCLETGFGRGDKTVLQCLKNDADNYDAIFSRLKIDKFGIVSFNYINENTGEYSGTVTNIIKITSKNGKPETRELIDELNDWYNKILSLGGEKNAKVLL